MKRYLSVISILTVIALFLCSCSLPQNNNAIPDQSTVISEEANVEILQTSIADTVTEHPLAPDEAVQSETPEQDDIPNEPINANDPASEIITAPSEEPDNEITQAPISDEITALPHVTDDPNQSEQPDEYEIFQQAVDTNVYDQWLAQVLAEGILSLNDIYGKYSALWTQEFHYTIENAAGLFQSTEDYEIWKAELNNWLEATTNVIRVEARQLFGQLPKVEILMRKCELIREKVIDIKYFCYILEGPADFGKSEDLTGLRWANFLPE